MKAQILTNPEPIESNPLTFTEVSIPEIAANEILIKVLVCGVCHTDLHVAEGELSPKHPKIIPGHQIVGTVEKYGKDVNRFKAGDRVGVTWLNATCQKCEYCRTERENLCDQALFTGYDRSGGFAEFTCIQADYAHAVPPDLPAEQTAPLLCAGVIGYRALQLSRIQPGQRLGLYGFGASAHVAIQIARYWGCEVYVFTRSAAHREHAMELGAKWTGLSQDTPPETMHSSILFAPAGKLVPEALRVLCKGGVLAINAVHMSPIPALPYDLIYHERIIQSVANCTRADAVELLKLAVEIPIKTEVEVYEFEQANLVLNRLKRAEIRGAAVLKISD
ncbi:MAG: zinc-dependent alcohol dehydrogenase family protein [bacterium]